MELKKYKLGEIAEIYNGSTPSTKEFDNYDGNIVWATPKDLSDQNSKYFYQGSRNITQKGFDSCSTQLIPANNILMSSRAPIGLFAINKVDCCTNQGFKNIVLDKKITDVDFMYYFLKYHVKEIEALGSGTTFKEVSKTSFEKYEISIPSLDNQQKIASVLSALDDKIALNRRMNAKLEQMAKRLYDYLFVQFDFPNENGKPYKSSGGRMEYNEVLKREIPAGWEVKSLGEVCDFPIERVSDKDISEKLYVPIEVIPRNEMSFSDTANIEKAASGLCSFSKRSILLSNRRVYFHKVCIAPFEGITRDTVIIINSKDLNNLGFIYQIVNSNHFIDYATLNSYGSEQPVLSTPTVQDYKFVYPNNGIDKIYSERVDGIINKVLKNNLEIRKLTTLRDRLLPLLMNGQVEVK